MRKRMKNFLIKKHEQYFRPANYVTFNELLCRKFPDYFNERLRGSKNQQVMKFFYSF